MQPWLTILGLRDGYPLPPMAVQAVAGAHWVVGSEKNIAQLRQQLPNGWGKATKVKKLLRPFVKNIQWVEDLHRRDKKTRVIFLATGDPNFFGATSIFAKQFGAADMQVFSAPAIVSLVAGHMGWAIEHCILLSVHGREAERPLAQIGARLYPDAKMIILTRAAEQLQAMAYLLLAAGAGDSTMTVFADVGTTQQSIFTATAKKMVDHHCASDFFTVAVMVKMDGKKTAAITMTTAGHSIDRFHHDGQITKAETRAVIMAQLHPYRGALLWDIGSGSGAVAVEWAHLGGRALAIEQSATRAKNIIANRDQFGLQQSITVMVGSAEKILARRSYPAPDAIFVGGGVSDKKLMARLWQLLPQGGRLVSASASVEGLMAQVEQQQLWGGQLLGITIERQGIMGRDEGRAQEINARQVSAQEKNARQVSAQEINARQVSAQEKNARQVSAQEKNAQQNNRQQFTRFYPEQKTWLHVVIKS